MHGRPSTSRRTSPSVRSAIPVTRPRRSSSGTRHVHERNRDVYHPLEVLDGDVLLGAVEVLDAVGEVQAGEPALVEDVRVGPATSERLAGLNADPPERGGGELYDAVVWPEAVAAVLLLDHRLDLAFADGGSEGERVDHFADEPRELPLVARPGLGLDVTTIADDVPRGAAPDHSDVRCRVLVDAAETKIADRPRRGENGRAAVLGGDARVRRASEEDGIDRGRPRCCDDELTERPLLVVDEAGPSLEPRDIERLGALEPGLLL